MKSIFKIIAIICAAVAVAAMLLSAGFVAGTMAQTAKDAPVVKKADTLKNLTSKVIPIFTGTGKVVKVGADSVTIASSGDELIVRVGQNAKIYALKNVPSTNKNVPSIPQQVPLSLSDLKPGDSASVSMKLATTGDIEAVMIMVRQQENK